MSQPDLPPYIERGGEQVVAGPFMQERTLMRGFVVRGDRDRLARLVDAHLTAASGGALRVRPQGDSIVVAVADIRRLAATSVQGARLGWMTEIDLVYWVPVQVTDTRSGERFGAWYIPYIFVDSGPAVATGREHYGFTKAHSRFELPEGIEAAGPTRVYSTVTERFGRESRASERMVAEIVRTAAEGPSRLQAMRALAPLVVGDGGPPGAGPIASVIAAASQLRTMAMREVPVIFLRQLRDVADPSRAAYQEILLASARTTAVRGAGLLAGAWELRVPHYDSHPIAADLGLRAGGHPVAAAFYQDFDFSMDLGRTLVRSTPGGGSSGRRSTPAPARSTTPLRDGKPASGSSSETRPRKVAVLGGGLGSLSAVFELTSQPGWQDRYDITVYQMGFRLGGKGASGRNPDACDRIEEHGLHVWFGFYHEAFRMMRRCYAEAGRAPGSPLSSVEDAFVRLDDVTLTEHIGERWIPWTIRFPRNDLVPGEDDLPSLLADRAGEGVSAALKVRFVARLAGRLAGWIAYVLEETVGAARDRAEPAGASSDVGVAASLLGPASIAGLTALLGLLRRFALSGGEAVLPAALSGRLVALVRRQIFERLEARIETSDESRRLWIWLDYALSLLTGILRDRLIERGLDAINDQDFTEWLRGHGASELTLASPLLRGGYDLVFGYEDGDTTRPNLAAGVALRGLLELLFGYHGSIMWKMNGGMGDVVFAPLYEVLRRRGVRFEFFHKVDSLGLSPDGTRIESISVERQATVRGGGEYQPLVDVKGMACWPDRPRFEQLVEGEELRAGRIDLESSWAPWPAAAARTLVRGTDFDEVVLGIPPAALRHVARELVERLPAWRDMVSHVTTVCTHAMQLWMRPDLTALGWVGGKDPDARGGKQPEPIMSGYVQPTSTWADMTHLAAVEGWPVGETPGHIAYFCGPLAPPEAAPPEDSDFPSRERARVLGIAHDFLDRDIGRLWPGAVDEEGRFRHELLCDPSGRTGRERLATQVIKANVEPTDRYTQSTAGSIKHRMRAGASGVSNLFLAGDWIDNGFNTGCVEATVLSGTQCAKAMAVAHAVLVALHEGSVTVGPPEMPVALHVSGAASQ